MDIKILTNQMHIIKCAFEYFSIKCTFISLLPIKYLFGCQPIKFQIWLLILTNQNVPFGINQTNVPLDVDI